MEKVQRLVEIRTFILTKYLETGGILFIFTYHKICNIMRLENIKNVKHKKFKIYVLKDYFTQEVRYVGVTTKLLRQRLSQHLYDAKKKGTHKRNWINSLLKKDVKPTIELLEICNYKNWEEREIHWISNYNNLTNTREGGAGVVLSRDKSSMQKSSEAKFKPIIAIGEDRKVLHFKSHKEASLKTKVPRTSIEYSITNINYCSYGYNFINVSDYYVGLEKVIKLTKKKPKYRIVYNNIEYSCLQFSKLIKGTVDTVYYHCRAGSKILEGKKINIIKI